MNGEQKPQWYFAYAQDNLKLQIFILGCIDLLFIYMYLLYKLF